MKTPDDASHSINPYEVPTYSFIHLFIHNIFIFFCLSRAEYVCYFDVIKLIHIHAYVSPKRTGKKRERKKKKN